MDNLQVDVEKMFGFFTITRLRELIEKMSKEGKAKVDLLNVEVQDLLSILLYTDFYYKVKELKQL